MEYGGKYGVRHNDEMAYLTQEQLVNLVSYDPSSGVFKYRYRKDSRGRVLKRSGEVVGSLAQQGYLVVRINYKLYYLHRLVWLYMYGCMPTGCIDHINHDKADNRLRNLRDVSNRENLLNLRLSKSNTSGHHGVCLHKQSGKWLARIKVYGKNLSLGLFSDIGEAAKARAEEDKKYGFTINLGGYAHRTLLRPRREASTLPNC